MAFTPKSLKNLSEGRKLTSKRPNSKPFLKNTSEAKVTPKFWVVTYPTKDSTVGDIFFGSDPNHYANQVRGGLKEKEVFGFYDNEKEAKDAAEKLISVPVTESILFKEDLWHIVTQMPSKKRDELLSEIGFDGQYSINNTSVRIKVTKLLTDAIEEGSSNLKAKYPELFKNSVNESGSIDRVEAFKKLDKLKEMGVTNDDMFEHYTRNWSSADDLNSFLDDCFDEFGIDDEGNVNEGAKPAKVKRKNSLVNESESVDESVNPFDIKPKSSAHVGEYIEHLLLAVDNIGDKTKLEDMIEKIAAKYDPKGEMYIKQAIGKATLEEATALLNEIKSAKLDIDWESEDWDSYGGMGGGFNPRTFTPSDAETAGSYVEFLQAATDESQLPALEQMIEKVASKVDPEGNLTIKDAVAKAGENEAKKLVQDIKAKFKVDFQHDIWKGFKKQISKEVA